jgi:rhodanese-related sulfurtransferase
MKPELRMAAICIAAAIIFGALSALVVLNYAPKSQQQMIKEFYATETAVSVSPSDFIYDLKGGKVDGLVVDLRTPSAYQAGHLVTAVNVPAGAMSEAQLVAAFERLPTDKPVITYCYSEYCMLSRNVGKALSDNGIYVEHMTAGWYEIQRDFSNYTVNGSNPGMLNATENYTAGACDPSQGGEFGC